MDREARLNKRKKRFIAAILIALVILTVFLHRQITRVVFSPLVEGAFYNVETDEKACSLTFEVVWGPGQTEEILDILDRYDVRATFFISGSWLRKYSDLAREIVTRGHELGLHGYQHKILTEMNDEELANDFAQSLEAMQEELNLSTNLFRPPYGELDQRVFNYAQKQGYTTVIWSINSKDWLNLQYYQMVNAIMKQIHKGAIILMHTHSLQTVKALPVLLQYLRYEGYEVLQFTELEQHAVQ